MKRLFEDFIEELDGVKVVKLDDLTYINDNVALVGPTKTKKERMHELEVKYHDRPWCLHGDFLKLKLRLHMHYQQQLQQVGLIVYHVPVRQIEERRMQRTLEEKKTIVIAPEAKDYVDYVKSFGSDKEIVTITRQPIKDTDLVQLLVFGVLSGIDDELPKITDMAQLTARLYGSLRRRNYQFMHREEPYVSSSFIDSKTSEFLFETAGRGGMHKYGRMYKFFERYFSAEHTYKRLLQQLNETPTIEQIQKKQELLQSFVDMGTNKLESLREKIANLDTTAGAIIRLSPPISSIVQHYRGKRGGRGLSPIFISNDYCYEEVKEALGSVVSKLPDSLEFPNSNNVNLSKVKRGINDVLSKENPNGFQNFIEYAKRLFDSKLRCFEDLLPFLKRSEDDTKLYDGVSRFLHAAHYMKRALSWLDLQKGLAEVVLKEGWSLPKIVPKEHEIIDIEGGYYPFMIEEKLGALSLFLDMDIKERVMLSPDKIVKNPTYLDKNIRVELVSGSNFNGKSCYVMHVPTIQVYGQTIGLVPASKAVLSYKDKVIVRLKRRGEIEHNESAFSGEVNEINRLLGMIKKNGRYALITLDEYLTSTDPRHGEAILYALIKDGIVPTGAKMLVTHHFPHLNKLAEESPAVTSSGFIPDRDGEKVIMNYRKTSNVIDTRSYGVEIAQQLGLPKHIVDSAKERVKIYRK